MRDVIKEVLDEYARSNFYSDSFRNHIAGEIEKRLGSITQNNSKIKRKYNSVETNEKVDPVKKTVTRTAIQEPDKKTVTRTAIQEPDKKTVTRTARQEPVTSDEIKKDLKKVVDEKSVKNLKSLTTKSLRKSKSDKSNTRRK